jgi:hypothetical protein
MEKETKKYLIIGTALVVSIGIGVVLWKKYQASSDTSEAASNAAADQSNQDELALIESSLEANAYAGEAGAQSYSPAVIGTGTPQTLAQEVTALEAALGFGPGVTASPTPIPTTPTTPAPTAAPSPTPAPAVPSPTTPVETGSPITVTTPMAEAIQYEHGAPIFEAEGVPGEGVNVS